MFKIGDTVVLNSDGPHMTVKATALDPSNSVECVVCVWFNEQVDYREASFPCVCVKHVTVK